MVRTVVCVCLVILALTAVAWGRGGYDEEGLDQITRRGTDPIDQIKQTWQQWGRVFVWAAGGLLLVAALMIINPFRIYDTTSDKLLKRAVRDVDELLKRIQQEAEAATEDSPKETMPEEGLLAGLAEVAEFTQAEQVPPYVLTVNDLMLDNVRIAIKRLRKFTQGNAERYRDYMFSVIQGIKTIAEQSAEAGAASGLAVDIREYFRDDKRYKAWEKSLRRAAQRGKHQEVAHAFLLFMRDVREGRSLTTAKPATVVVLAEAAAVSAVDQAAGIPNVVNEETLPAIQQAAAREARKFYASIQTGKPSEPIYAWQFEFVRRQQQMHWRDEAQRMLAIFLNCERRSLQEITKIRMLPCRTWEHILHMLGVADGAQLHKRADERLLTTQEITILEKAFLQTFAKRESLKHVYGHDEGAGLMLDLHLPQVRHEALLLLRTLHQTEADSLADATQVLNDEETPKNNEVRRLIEHCVHHRHDPPGMDKK
jgi:hypothetical protein